LAWGEEGETMKIGIVGSGTMGASAAMAFAMSGRHSVVLTDVSLALAEAGKDRIRKKLTKLMDKGKLEPDRAESVLGEVLAAEKAALAGCDLVLEAAAESLEVKRALFGDLAAICGKGIVFATNTSSLSVAKIGEGLDRPVVGLHFFNPAETMPLVEIAAGPGVPEEIVGTVRSLAESIGKTPIMVSDSPGFVVNRLLIPMINEAVALLDEKVAEAKDIDTAMKLGAGHPMGPLELADLIGLDVCLAIMESLREGLGDERYRPHPLLASMVAQGRLGRKTGGGFYQRG
jgi:3-hydroxybutyryl-CoA dehydrogenase